ncbi:MAG: class D beta-lactamase [Ignavibacteriaceae bacterium]|nr:class D beta-lactamase [Ignavibacteriaceae bacterium]
MIKYWKFFFKIRVICYILFFAGINPTLNAQINNAADYYSQEGVSGAFLLYNFQTDQFASYNLEDCKRRTVPASTFKILNSIIALEKGVFSNIDEQWQWDGVERRIKSWNQNNSLRTGMKYSVVPLYQYVAREVGLDYYNQILTEIKFGNALTGEKVDEFWLTGPLEISPMEQVQFLIKFISYDLPFSKENIDAVKETMLLEETETYKLFAKTGWAQSDKRNIGWFIGFVQKGDNYYIFANRIEADENIRDSFGTARREISEKILKDLKILE